MIIIVIKYIIIIHHHHEYLTTRGKCAWRRTAASQNPPNRTSISSWMLWAEKLSLKQIDDDSDEKVPGDEEGNETPEQLRTYFTLNDNLKPVGVRRQFIVSLEQYWWYYHNDQICFIWQMTIQGQFGGLSLPEVEEDAWSVKDYIEWKRNQDDQAFDLKKTQWHPMTWKRHN